MFKVVIVLKVILKRHTRIKTETVNYVHNFDGLLRAVMMHS